MEFRVAQHMMEGKDFFEGVRSVLIDRDNKPTWAHESIEAVTSDEVEAFFQEPVGGGKFELQLPTERGDSIAFPPAGQVGDNCYDADNGRSNVDPVFCNCSRIVKIC